MGLTVKPNNAIYWIMKIVCGSFLTAACGAFRSLDVSKRPPMLLSDLRIIDLVKHLG
jgi:hypothetical protein